MRFGQKIMALAAAVATLAALAGTAQGAATHADRAHASVIGGTTAKIEDYPWLSYIEGGLDSGLFSFSCTGTVIAPRVVLTAGHCTYDLEAEVVNRPRGYLVATGVANHKHVPSDHTFHVSRVLLYPGFRPTFVHGDAGLLILSQPTTAPPIAMAGAGDSALLGAGTPIEVAGWGLTNFKRETEPDLAQVGKLSVQDTARCRTGGTDLHRHFSPALQLCALDTPAFKMSGCFGDSGGPAIAHRPDGTPVELGIVSSGGFECEPRVPNLYTRVDRVSQWASEWVAAVETGAPEPAIPPLPAPAMDRLEADILGVRALADDFGGKQRRQQLAFIHSVVLQCTRASRSRFNCHAHWQRGDGRFYGSVSVFYTPHTGPVTWNDEYTIHRVSASCLRKGNRGCPVHTRTRKPGPPKKL